MHHIALQETAPPTTAHHTGTVEVVHQLILGDELKAGTMGGLDRETGLLFLPPVPKHETVQISPPPMGNPTRQPSFSEPTAKRFPAPKHTSTIYPSCHHRGTHQIFMPSHLQALKRISVHWHREQAIVRWWSPRLGKFRLLPDSLCQ